MGTRPYVNITIYMSTEYITLRYNVPYISAGNKSTCSYQKVSRNRRGQDGEENSTPGSSHAQGTCRKTHTIVATRYCCDMYSCRDIKLPILEHKITGNTPHALYLQCM